MSAVLAFVESSDDLLYSETLQVRAQVLFLEDDFFSDCVFEGQRKYISIFLCIVYFRLPEVSNALHGVHVLLQFKQQLLANTLTEEERNQLVPEWRGTEFELDSATLKKLEDVRDC